ELRAEALKAAKEKANYLLGSIDEKLGGALEIQEIDYEYQPPVYARSVAYDAAAAESKVGYQSELEFKTITIKSEFRVVFEIE
ncbi:MAG: SIMPL domain-containing protein, partial [Cytophagales bacterium]|nr:SIMPL domain-containing protein [Cytophagales bacterium]